MQRYLVYRFSRPSRPSKIPPPSAVFRGAQTGLREKLYAREAPARRELTLKALHQTAGARRPRFPAALAARPTAEIGAISTGPKSEALTITVGGGVVGQRG